MGRVNILRIQMKIGFPIRSLTKNSSFFFSKFKVPRSFARSSEVTTESQERRSLAEKMCIVEPKELRHSQDAQRASFGWQTSQSTQPEKGSGRLYSACDWGSLVKVRQWRTHHNNHFLRSRNRRCKSWSPKKVTGVASESGQQPAASWSRFSRV